MIAAWLGTRAAGLAGRWLTLLLIAAAGLLPFWLCYRWGYSSAQAEHRSQAAAAQTATLNWLVNQHERNAQLAGDYILRRAATAIVYQQIIREIPHVVTVYRATPGDPLQPVPHCVFTGGFVRLWNAANAGGESVPASAGSAAASPGAAAAADPEPGRAR